MLVPRIGPLTLRLCQVPSWLTEGAAVRLRGSDQAGAIVKVQGADVGNKRRFFLTLKHPRDGLLVIFDSWWLMLAGWKDVFVTAELARWHVPCTAGKGSKREHWSCGRRTSIFCGNLRILTVFFFSHVLYKSSFICYKFFCPSVHQVFTPMVSMLRCWQTEALIPVAPEVGLCVKVVAGDRIGCTGEATGTCWANQLMAIYWNINWFITMAWCNDGLIIDIIRKLEKSTPSFFPAVNLPCFTMSLVCQCGMSQSLINLAEASWWGWRGPKQWCRLEACATKRFPWVSRQLSTDQLGQLGRLGRLGLPCLRIAVVAAWGADVS